MFRRFSRHMVHRLVLGSLVVAALFVAPGPRTHAAPAAGGTYTNPLDMRTQDGKRVESCADPSIIHGQTPGDTAWYMYCTMDPLGSWDTIATGDPNFHIITMHRSLDLVHWTYVGDVF